MYEWRKMTPTQREELLCLRRRHQHPWHSPSHRAADSQQYLITAACYEHHPFIGRSAQRMAGFVESLLTIFHMQNAAVHAWVVLPNHYHVLTYLMELKPLLKQIGLLHGRTSYQWNAEDHSRGRQVWCKATETGIKSDRHFWAALNYVHHNPVRHGYAETWQAWPFSSAADYLAAIGRERAKEVWQEYPVLDFGREWDPPGM